MGIGANSYGSADGVVALVPQLGGNGVFGPITRPTLVQVEGFIDQTSAILNSILAANGFTVPITQADCKLALTMFVNEEVAAIANGVNGNGRFGPTAKAPGKSRFNVIMDDVQTFVETNAAGFANMGAPRPRSTMASILYRDGDDSGEAVDYLFTRNQFGGDELK